MYDFNTVCQAMIMYGKNSYRTVSREMGISKSIVHHWKKDLEMGILRNRTKKPKSKRKVTSIIVNFLCERIKKYPFLTLGDLRRMIFKQHSIQLAESTISKILKLNKKTPKTCSKGCDEK